MATANIHPFHSRPGAPGSPDLTDSAIARGAEFLLSRDDVRNDLVEYAANIVTGTVAGPGIHLDDSSGIPLLSHLPMPSGFQLRARLRAATGDVVLSNHEPPAGYELYNSGRLGLGHARWLRPGADTESMTVADDCLANPACLAALASLLHRRPGYLHPYMSAEGTWRLAAELTARSGSPVSVLGPPPALTALVNNKCSFLEVARLVAGERSVIPFCAASELAGVAPFIDRLRGRASHFVIRLADSTAGLGARKLSVDSMPAGTALRRELEVILTALGWDGRGDFLLTEWVPSLASVSAQLWIPPGDTGNPACEGVYRQHLNPDNGMQFWGAAPARLPAALDAELRRLSCLLCLTFQRAGYVGRCSFDFVLAGEHLDSATPVFVECNGRWGGVSAVMSLVDRISRCGVRPAHTFGPVSGDSLRGADLRDVLAVLGGDLYDARQRNGQGIVLYYPGGLPSGRVDLCAVGPDQEFTRDLRELGAQKLGCAA